uniref:DOG1 domain-containing protein n=1 Tax=Fagus sylvatica TaxID=28930 RepID=A0A2N9GWC9_FAGSY
MQQGRSRKLEQPNICMSHQGIPSPFGEQVNQLKGQVNCLWGAYKRQCSNRNQEPLFQFKDDLHNHTRKVKDLTDEQTRRMEEVKAETKNGEKELTETLARLQQSVAAPPMVALARRIGRIMDGEISSLDSAIEALKTSMLRVLEDADSLRKSTVSKVVEILSPVQTLKFLAAAAQFQLQVRRWGMERDSQKALTGVV